MLTLNGQPVTIADLESRRMDGQPTGARRWQDRISPALRKAKNGKTPSRLERDRQRTERRELARAFVAARMVETERFLLSELAAHMRLTTGKLGSFTRFAGILTKRTYHRVKGERNKTQVNWVVGLDPV